MERRKSRLSPNINQEVSEFFIKFLGNSKNQEAMQQRAEEHKARLGVIYASEDEFEERCKRLGLPIPEFVMND